MLRPMSCMQGISVIVMPEKLARIVRGIHAESCENHAGGMREVLRPEEIVRVT